MSESLERHKADADHLKVGQLITTPQQRDAIHVAVAPAEAAQRLYVGDFVRLGLDGKALKSKRSEAVGIVDPFLGNDESDRFTSVDVGQVFWIFLFPGSITGMRHAWEHPAFDSQPAEAPTARALIKKRLYAAIVEHAYVEPGEEEQIVQAICTYHDNPERGCMPFDGDQFMNDHQFWNDLQIITGRQFSNEFRGTYFRCAC